MTRVGGDIFIIAEAGVNHNGDRDMAFELVDAAQEAGADAVKFQTFKAENIVIKSAVKANYQLNKTDANETQFEMLKRLELGHAVHYDLKRYCNSKGLEFLSTAFDLDSLHFLNSDLGLNKLKIPSGEITNGPLLLAHSLTGCELIVSTGMTTLEEIENGLSVIAYGLTRRKNYNSNPSKKHFLDAYRSEEGQKLLKEKVTLLHCTTEYPAPEEDINLKAMQNLYKLFGLKVGYSDHSEGIFVSTLAAALGATIIEKHFTLDKSLPGPDHAASLNPIELKDMVNSIRKVKLILGDGVKVPKPSELANRDVARKSIIAASEIVKGDIFTKKNISIKRPGTGLSPMEYWDLLGKKSQQDFSVDEVIVGSKKA